MRVSIRILVLLAAAGLPGRAEPGQAQAVVVRVVEDSTRRPLEGVVVRLLQQGRPVAMGLTGAGGRVRLAAPPGRYQLAAARIGHEPPPPADLTLEGTATLEQTVVMPSTVRRLPTLVVTGDTRCDARPGGGTLAAALWDEVQTALRANRITADQGLEQLHVTTYEQDWSVAREFLRERILTSTVTTGQPFAAVPLAELMAHGFVRRFRDSVVYAAPDAAVLLADEFVSTHCFRVEAHPSERGLLGLTFEPAAGRRLPDVRGTLWVDRGSRELRYLDYTYLGLDEPERLGEPGGRLEFERLPSGAWIVREWQIRMPRVAERRLPPGGVGERYSLLGMLVRGGRARTGATAPSPAAGRSVLAGQVFDSLTGRPLGGAIVSVDGEPDSTTSDADGGFRLEVQGAGPRVVRISHPRLGLVADNSAQEVRLSVGRVTTVQASVPPLERFVPVFCGASRGAAGVLGQLLDSRGRPLEGVSVRAAWLTGVGEEGRPGQRQARVAQRTLTTSTGTRGLFSFCDLPFPLVVTFEALSSAGTPVAAATVRTERGRFVWVALALR